MVMRCLPTSRFKCIERKDFHLNKYNKNNSKGYVLEVDLKYPEVLRELHNDYPLFLDKIEIKQYMLSKYQLIIVEFYKITMGSVIKQGPNFLDEEKKYAL